MTPGRWQEIEEAFLTALDLPEPSRAGFLAGLEESLRVEVAGMLDAHEDDRLLPPFLPIDPQSGIRIGPYRLIELIGKGGMGLVYRAERSDGELPKQVAVKMLRSQITDDEEGRDGVGLARFRIERQVLALLEHPNIVRLLDGGVMNNGTPYLVMELVEGEPITKYCDARKLDTAVRLGLFRTVCAAIGQAHRQLVIHRDIKPANILVTGTGDVKVLDFGIAKLLAPPPGQEQVTTHRAPLTPGYASPEQIRGEQVTVASDIYSLGAVLYELLTGMPARQNSGDAPGPYVASEPTRPSVAAARNGSPRNIGPDLDSIVLKAMAIAPADRYASVAEMERDLAFYLTGAPVMARQATLRYVLGKAVRRHRIKLVAALAAVLLIAGAIVWDARRVAVERNRRYEQIFEVARTMIVDMEGRIKDLPGSLEARKTLADRALSYLESLRKEATGDSRFETELARTYLQMADLQGGVAVTNLGDAKGATASLEAARQLSESVLSREPGHIEASQSLARYYAAVAINRQYARDLEHARVAAEKSLDIRRALAAAHPGDPGLLYDVAAATQVLATAIALSDPKKSEALFVESSRLIDRLLESDPHNRVLLRSAALAAKNISSRFSERRQFAEALGYAERARHLDEGLLEANPKDRGARLDLSFDLCSIGWLHHDANQLDGAVRSLRDCVDIRRQLVSEEPKDIRARDRLAYASMLLAETLLAMEEREGAMAEAEAAIRESNEVIRIMPSMEGTTLVQLSNAYRIRGMALDLAGRRAAACDDFRKASQGFDRLDQLGRAVSFAHREAEAARTAKARCDG